MIEKMFLFSILFSASSNGLSDSTCGSIKSTEFAIGEDVRMNGSSMPNNTCMPFPNCPYRCKQYYLNQMIEAVKKMVQGLYEDKLIDLDVMKYEILLLRNETNAEMMDQIIEKIDGLRK